MNFGDLVRSAAARHPDITALFCRDRAMSYAELDRSSDALAAWFVGQGFQPGDRIALQWPNAIETVQLYFAIFKAGLIAVPINLRLKPAEIAWILADAGAALCFSHPSLAAAAQGSGVEVRTELPQPGVNPTPALPGINEGDACAIIYTSGSTGRPKGAVHTHRSLLAPAHIHAADLMERYAGHSGMERGLVMTPMMHVSGLYALFSMMMLGQSSVLLPMFQPGAVLDAIEGFHCTMTLTLPALMQFILEEQLRKPRDVSSLKVIFAGGDSVPVALQNRVREILGVELLEGLAQTETGSVMGNPLQSPRPGSVGRVSRGVSVRVVNSELHDVKPGETGELLVRGDGVCTGYWNNPEATAGAFHASWFRTGDLVSCDPDGYYWFRGRCKEVIIRGGSNISPQEVEEALYTHPEILEAGVVGMPHEIWGEVVVAFVALRRTDAADADNIRQHARQHLAEYKVPEVIYFLPVLPKGATGKVHRKSLRDSLLNQVNVSAENPV